MSSIVAELHNVSVYRNGRYLIENIDITVERKKIVSIIGPNGGGKSTAIKVLAGSMQADSGTVKRAENLRIGYVPQKFHIEPTMPMTVRRLMHLTETPFLRNLTKAPSNTEIDAVLDEMGILDLADSLVQTLSGGELQRALFARALIKKPQLLILDEPSEGLDITATAKLFDQIVEYRDSLECGIVLISHKLNFVMAQTDSVVCMNRHVCCSGRPGSSLYKDEEFKQLFGDEVARSLAIYTHQHDHTHAEDGNIIAMN